MPPAIAAHFTLGEQAVLAVVAREVQRSGRCEFCLDKIAAIAGVCRTLVQNSIREARRLGLLAMTERRRRGAKSLTNVISIVSAEWSGWLKLRRLEGIGFRKNHPTDTSLFPSLETAAAAGRKGAFREGRGRDFLERRHP
ncbi:hypothetical protein [Rhodoblastus sp.]|uniref:hypothetical protein n=1 Tax=Rhodoblastus sp. TaxID=1962975 RepID=UPI003F9A83A6